MVYVIAKDNSPLMPTENHAKVRVLLKTGRAKVLRRTPFTIRLLYDTEHGVQETVHGIDTGSAHVGSSVYANGKIIYTSQVEIRNDIKDLMDARRKYRRTRRARKTRYREPRFLNRSNSTRTDRLPSTMQSKLACHEREIRYTAKMLPVSRLILETGTFDPHLLKNPDLGSPAYRSWGYQKGTNYGFYNTKAYVLARDGYTCQCCKGKHKDSKLEVHHILFRSNGGSDEAENLITLCKTCHDKVHAGDIKLKGGKAKGQLRHATQMNSIRKQLLLQNPEAHETFGFVTKEHRQLMGLSKEHYHDAVAIANLNNLEKYGLLSVDVRVPLLRKKCIFKGDYQQTKGIRSEQSIQTGKIMGFRKFDKVEYAGQECFIKGRMSTGYAILMGIDGMKIPLKPIPKFDRMKRLSARKSWIMQQEIIQNIA